VCRLLLFEPSRSNGFLQLVSNAGAQAQCAVEPLASQDLEAVLQEGMPEGVMLGVGPSVSDPIQVARRVRLAGNHAPVLFFGESESRLDAIRAELLRDPFACERCELLRADDPRLLARGLARAARQAGRTPAARALRSVARRPATPQPQVRDHFMASILDQANDAIMATDKRGRLLTWNAAAERVFGYSADEVLGQAIGMLDLDLGHSVRSAHSPCLSDMVGRVLRGRVAEQREVSCRRADGRGIDLTVGVAPVQDEQGQAVGLSIIARDNADQRRAAEALREANRQKDEFLAIMSHELRTPLTSIIGYTDMLLRGLGGPLEPRSERYVGNVRTAGDRLLELVNGLLDFTRLEAGREHLSPRPTSLLELVRAAVERCRSAARAKHIHLVARLDRSADRVMGDPDKLEYVVQSYLTNALKFTPEKGRIHVQVAPDPEHADQVRVSVSDSGIGLRDDQLARVWERFYQADASLTRAYGGMGLGLSIARHLVLLHGGHVGADSPGPGHGSTFWMSLPRAAAT
jgi:PAS domain S-box-containing protein